MNPFAVMSESLFQLLVWLNSVTGNLGLAILALTVIVRGVLVPLTLPGQKKQIENRNKLKKLQPEIKKLKDQYKNDRTLFAQKQMELYKKHNIQLFSLSTLLPFAQLFVLFALYHVLLKFLKDPNLVQNATFLGFNLLQKDSTYVLPVISAVTQLLLSVMLLPGLEHHDLVQNDSKDVKVEQENKKEEDQQEMAEAMMQQMVFMLPAITFVFSLNFPAAVVLYWIATTIFSIAQQYLVSGWGGLSKYMLMIPGLAGLVKSPSIPVVVPEVDQEEINKEIKTVKKSVKSKSKNKPKKKARKA